MFNLLAPVPVVSWWAIGLPVAISVIVLGTALFIAVKNYKKLYPAMKVFPAIKAVISTVLKKAWSFTFGAVWKMTFGKKASRKKKLQKLYDLEKQYLKDPIKKNEKKLRKQMKKCKRAKFDFELRNMIYNEDTKKFGEKVAHNYGQTEENFNNVKKEVNIQNNDNYDSNKSSKKNSAKNKSAKNNDIQPFFSSEDEIDLGL